MTPEFKEAFRLVLGHEGGYTNSRHDRGNWTSGKIGKGVLKGTKFGISAMAYPELDIKNLTVPQAEAIYWKDYWLAAGCHNLPVGVSFLVFDGAVNHGAARSVKFLQSAVGSKADGKLGPLTLKATLDANPVSTIINYCLARQLFFNQISTFSRYGVGWTRRTFGTLSQALILLAAPPLDQSKVEPEVPEDDPEQPTFWKWLLS